MPLHATSASAPLSSTAPQPPPSSSSSSSASSSVLAWRSKIDPAARAMVMRDLLQAVPFCVDFMERVSVFRRLISSTQRAAFGTHGFLRVRGRGRRFCVLWCALCVCVCALCVCACCMHTFQTLPLPLLAVLFLDCGRYRLVAGALRACSEAKCTRMHLMLSHTTTPSRGPAPFRSPFSTLRFAAN